MAAATRPGRDAGPPAAVRAWVERTAGPGRRVRVTASLSQSGSGGPWRLDIDAGAETHRVVLKLGDAADPDVRRRFATEAAALETARRHDLAAPRLVAADPAGTHAGAAVLLATLLPGSSRIPKDADRERLRALGAAAAAIHGVRIQVSEVLPPRARSLEGAALGVGGAGDSAALLDRARARLDALGPPPPEPYGLVHGDLWHGNTMWDGGRYMGALDWDFAGVGPAGVDLGSLRCDAAVMYGPEAADEVLAGWAAAHGEPPANVAWWDLISALATPPDMGAWLPNFHAQGRTDLTLELVTGRRDTYLATALDSL